MDPLVVGSGFFGLTFAREAAEQFGINVTVIERRDHIGDNTYSSIDEVTGVEVHQYGTHLFHTSNERVWSYINRFTAFNDYRHRVYANYRGVVYSLLINLGTINQFFGAAYSPAEARALIEQQAVEITGEPDNLEEKAISLTGHSLYDALIAGYTTKQWQTDPYELAGSIIARLPVCFTYENRYFQDCREGLPLNGYGTWITNMVDHPRITVYTGVDLFDTASPFSRAATVGQVPVVYTGTIDRYFDYEAGKLGWRTLDFETEVVDVPDYQGCSVINYSDRDVFFTRIHEFAHLHSERGRAGTTNTIVQHEYSRFARPGDEPYYPIASPSDRSTLVVCRDMAAGEKNALFGGRLGSYQYLDMHMAIASALTRADKVVTSWC